MSNARGESAGGVQSVDRAISVLEILAQRGEAGVSEVAAEIGVHKSTAFRLLAALEERGLVEQAQERGKYRLGFGILRLAGAVTGRLDVTQQGRAGLRAARRAARRDRQHRGAAGALRRQPRPGARAERGRRAQLGRPADPVARHLQRQGPAGLHDPRRAPEAVGRGGLARLTPHTITSQRELEKQLDAAARDGYASSVEELEDGLNAIAAPVRDRDGGVIAALSRLGPGLPVHRGADARADPRCGRRRGGDQPPDGLPRLTGTADGHFVELRLHPVVELADVVLAGHQHPAVARKCGSSSPAGSARRRRSPAG